MFKIDDHPPARFRYRQARSGRAVVGWYIREVQHFTGVSGYVSNHYPDRRWRVSGNTPSPAGQPSYATRNEAALAEWQLASDAKIALNKRIAAWLKFGIELLPDEYRKWHWRETAGDDDPSGWKGVATGPFQSFADCEASVIRALGGLPPHLLVS